MAEPTTKFDYLLNVFEEASQHEKPATQGYAEKRAAVLAYVHELERIAATVRDTMHLPARIDAKLRAAISVVDELQETLLDIGASPSARHALDAVYARSAAASSPSEPKNG